MWFITRPIAFSLPGISRAENTTTSSGAELDVTVVVDRDPRQRRLRLSLRAGADADDVLRRESCARRCRESARPAGMRR